jgi:hypothetical protein
MKKRVLIGLILVSFLFACKRSDNNGTPTAVIQIPVVDGQSTKDMTREYFAMQTIIAGEQLTNTPTPEKTSNLPKAWTEITTITPIDQGGGVGSPTPTSTLTVGPISTPGAEPIFTPTPEPADHSPKPTATKAPPTATKAPPTATKPPPTAPPPTAPPPTAPPPTPAPLTPAPP